MKLYSRNQVIVVSAICVVVAFGIAVFGLNLIPRAQDNLAQAVQYQATQAPTSSIPTAKAYSADTVDTAPTEYTEDEKQNISVYEKYSDAVVNITTENLSYDWFSDPVVTQGGTGSGSIIDSQGYVLTNNHVIDGAVKVYVNLADGSQYEGKVIGADAESDLAVIKFTPAKGKVLTTIPYGDSSKLKVGQKVLAIGNPYTLDRTLTRGIVSSLHRLVQGENNLMMQDMIQTDASINPGNSGGPLLNSKGEMIGINAMIYSTTGGSVGIGFAIPIDTAKRIVPELMKYGMVKRGWIDLAAYAIDIRLVQGLGLSVDKGLLVQQVTKGGNADRAGIRGGTEAYRIGRSVVYAGGDIITKVNGKAVTSFADYYAALESSKPGDKVQVEYVRGKDKLSTTVILSQRSSNSAN